MNLNKYLIKDSASIIEALEQINNMGKNETLTLFVISTDNIVVGTLTDGDIRRYLIKNKTLDSNVLEIAHRNFTYLTEGCYDINKIHEAKRRGVDMIPILDSEGHIADFINLKKQKSYLPIDAVLMAGGKGERMRPLTDKTPKPLLTIDGKPIIDHIIEHIISYGIKNISVTVNYLKEQIENHFSKPFENIKINTVREPDYLGTIGSLAYVKEFKHDTVLLMNSDAITDINLEDFYADFKEKDADMSIAAVPYTVSIPYGILDLNGSKITGIQEKPTYNYYANTGIYLIKRKLLKYIPEGSYCNATDYTEMLINGQFNVICYPFSGTWMDIGSQQEYQKAITILKHNQIK